MEEVIQWISSKFDVLFSGLGVYVLSLIIGGILYVFIRSSGSSANKVKQSGIVAGGDVVGRDKKG